MSYSVISAIFSERLLLAGDRSWCGDPELDIMQRERDGERESTLEVSIKFLSQGILRRGGRNVKIRGYEGGMSQNPVWCYH